MLIVSSRNGAIGIPAGWAVLQRGGSALDAVEAATRVAEDNADDHTVGYGGYPNVLGEVELKASIMEGSARQAGAVAAMLLHGSPAATAGGDGSAVLVIPAGEDRRVTFGS